MISIRQAAALAVTGIFFTTASFAGAQTAKTPKQAAIVNKAAKNDFSFLNGKTGTGPFAMWSEESLTGMINKQLGSRIKTITYNETMGGSLAMLKSGRADFMLTSDVSANYVIQRNQELKSLTVADNLGFVMILRKSEGRLRDSFNAAISNLKASGKLAELHKKWITELPVGQEPGMPEIVKTSYPETVYVGVSGDYPPLDYVAPDGKPSGYNIALLAEISKLIGKNIEVVSINSLARFAALKSKRIDVFFWLFGQLEQPGGGVAKKFKDQALAQNLILTEPYCNSKLDFLLKK